MADWVPLRNNKELVGLLARVDLESSTAAVPQDPSHRLGLFNSGTAPQQHDPLRGAHVGVLEERPGPIVFTPEPAKAALSEKSFIQAADDDFEDIDAEAARLHSLSPPRAGGNRVYVLASVGFFVTALTILGVVLFGGGQKDGEPQTVKTVEKIVEKVVYRDRVLPADNNRDNSADDKDNESQAVAAATAAGRNKKASPQKKKPSEDKTKELMERLGVSTPNSRAPIGGSNSSAGAESSVGASGQTDGLDANQMKRVVNSNKGSLKNCYERSLKKGEVSDNRDLRVNFKLTVGTSGLVKKVALSGEGANTSSLNSCLTQSVKRWVFPPSSRESNLEFPFVFSPTG